MNKILKNRFIGLWLIVVVLIVATIVDTLKGNNFTFRYFYHSWWFIALVLITFLLFLVTAIFDKDYKYALPRFGVIVSVGVILLGGWLSCLTATRGSMHLRQGEPMTCMNTNAEDIILPFSLTLNNFKVITYPGTPTPANYESSFSIQHQGQIINAEVSMNKPFRYRGYRFYQMSYDSDLSGSVLSVSRDVPGTMLTYAGYLLFVLSLLAMAGKYFLKSRKKNLLAGVLLLFIPGHFLQAQSTLTREEASRLGHLSLFYQGRVAPVSTYARDFTITLTGKTTYKHFTAEQVLAGWLFFPEEWQHEPMLKIKNKELRQKLGLAKYISFTKLYSPTKELLIHYADLPLSHKGRTEVMEKVAVIMQLTQGSTLSIFPRHDRWYAPTDNFSHIIAPTDTLFMSGILQLLYEAVDSNKHEEVDRILEKMAIFQSSHAEANAINPLKLRIEICLNHFDFPSRFFPVVLFLSLLAFVYLLCKNIYNKPLKFAFWGIFALMAAVASIETFFIIAQTYVSGHFPVSNSHETFLLLSWIFLLFALFFAQKSDILFFAAPLLAGFLLLVCSLNVSRPRVTPLMPVLQSPWLNIHVSLVMLAYALFALITIIAIMYILVHLWHRKRIASPALNSLTLLSRQMLVPAVALLALGIISGSIWANLSWGRYWGWDPKEVWALITLLVYSVILADKSSAFFKKDIRYHWFAVFAFLFVLMTYLGVNLWFAGLHSYA
ncbi:MAG: cytochrome c biogenesis protein CcsA [Bacteroidales bacterium]|jgi:cytochrome c-type biogenesis protein CcsB|nr:cytochrome c biogenesis protein CcsA [Bacteroidales bacterium]